MNPLRRFAQNPVKILGSFVKEGMIVLEPGPGMGFFTLDLARLVGPAGRVIAVDIQPRMLEGLRCRAKRAGLLDRLELRIVPGDRMGLEELQGAVDFVLAFALVHELPDANRFFREIYYLLRPGCRLLIAEPLGHVRSKDFSAMLEKAEAAGLRVESRPIIPRSWSAVLLKPPI